MQLRNVLEKQFIGADDLRKELTNILNSLSKDGEVVITQHGQPKGVLMDVATYLKIQELEDDIADYDPKLVKRVNRAVEESRKGNVVPAEEVFKKLGI